METQNFKKNISIPNYKLSPLYRFFIWCSGARLYLVRSCPTDYNKYFGIGIIIFLTGVMALITGAYALFTVFDNPFIATIFGLFWGVLIFFLDWFIVSSLKKEEKILSEILFAVPRILLAVLLAVVISKPLELKLFENEINAEIVKIKSIKTTIYKNNLSSEFDEIKKLEAENNKLQAEITKKEAQREELFAMIVAEAEGKSPTGKIGKGPVYKEKKAEFDIITKELAELRNLNQQQIIQNQKEKNRLTNQKNQKFDINNVKINQADGLLMRLEALSSLSAQNKTVYFSSWFIFILFVLIESAPILVKLLSRRGPYDELIDKEEYEKQIEYKKQKIKAKVIANNYLELLKQKDELQIEAEKRNNENLINEIEQARDDINKEVVRKWKDKELTVINLNPDQKNSPDQISTDELVTENNSSAEQQTV